MRRRLPFSATYRLQLGPDLSFTRARELVPYLRDLGVSHLYLSPSLQARPGSTHGYDVVDPTRISRDLGGEEEFRALCEAGLGVLLDIVPNHMATDEEHNRYWADPELRRKFFDWDEESGWYRRFFTVGELAGVLQEDREVFEETHRKVFELLEAGLVDGLRIDHPDGLADPAAYLNALAARGAKHVWVEKILEPGEQLRPWPVEGTTGYEFANDVTALFVDPAAEERLTRNYEELTGERRSFSEIADEAKLEFARLEYSSEVERLAAVSGLPLGELTEAVAALGVYRTYLDGGVDPEDEHELRQSRIPGRVTDALLANPSGEFTTRFQQTTAPVMAKGVEDTAFYRYFRLTALNEVGGSPDRFSLSVDRFHAANLTRAARFPRHLLATQTHDTKRSGDVRARIVALSWHAHEWIERRREWRALVDPAEDELLWQTLVGAWPIEPERIEAYLEKALREAKVNTSWLEPNEEHERRVKEAARRVVTSPPAGFEQFAARIAEDGHVISLAMTLLKLTVPGVPDIYQGDELESLSLVDPDNRRPVDWERRRRALDELRAGTAPTRETAKLYVTWRALQLRSRQPEAFDAPYAPVAAGADVCAFLRGHDVAVVVPIRQGATASVDLGAGWTDLLGPLPVRLLERLG